MENKSFKPLITFGAAVAGLSLLSRGYSSSLGDIKGRGLSVRKIYDNGGKTFDRYTVFFYGMNYALGLSLNPESPQGFSQWVEAKEGRHLGKVISINVLPVNVNRHIRIVEKLLRSDEKSLQRGEAVYMVGEIQKYRPKTYRHFEEDKLTSEWIKNYLQENPTIMDKAHFISPITKKPVRVIIQGFKMDFAQVSVHPSSKEFTPFKLGEWAWQTVYRILNKDGRFPV